MNHLCHVNVMQGICFFIKKLAYNVKKKNLKMFWYDLKLLKKIEKKRKIYSLSKNHVYSNLIVNKHMTCWGKYKYNKLKIENSFL